MGRDAKAWYWAAKKGWFVELGGKQIPLVRRCARTAETRREAAKRLRATLQERDRGVREGMTLAALCDLFEDHLIRDREPLTREWYLRHLGSFVSSAGAKTSAATVRPLDVSAWLGKHAWGPTTRHGAVTAVKRLYRWAKKEGHLEHNPLIDVEKPTPKRRELVMSNEQIARVLEHVESDPFGDFLTAMRETGARPGEVQTLTADRIDMDSGVWHVVNKTRHATGEGTRRVYLNAPTLELSRRLLASRPEGIVFLNARGRPWTRNAVACRFRAIKGALGFGGEAVAYSLRHAYITDALERGIPPATVAELVGHQDLKMIMRIYNRLRHRTDHLREAATRARAPISSSANGSACRPDVPSPSLSVEPGGEPDHPGTPTPHKT